MRDMGSRMQVLNVAHAKLTGEQDVGGLKSLGALIINDNRVASLAGESGFRQP